MDLKGLHKTNITHHVVQKPIKYVQIVEKGKIDFTNIERFTTNKW